MTRKLDLKVCVARLNEKMQARLTCKLKTNVPLYMLKTKNISTKESEKTLFIEE